MMVKRNSQKSLAQEILDEALNLWVKEGDENGEHREIVHMPNGDVAIAINVGKDDLQFGRIYSHYLPIGAAEEMLKACKREFDMFTVVDLNTNGEVVRNKRLKEVKGKRGERENHIRKMALVAMFFLLKNLSAGIKQAMLENFEDSLAIVGAMLGDNIAGVYGGKVNAGSNIRALAKDSAERRERRLRYFLEQLENVLIFINKGGRPKKLIDIEDVFIGIRKRGKKALKKQVAYDLKISQGTITKLMKEANLATWRQVIEAAFANSDKESQ